MKKKIKKPTGLDGKPIPKKVLAFWLQPTFPQYRKIVNGKQKCLDGTETKDTEIVKYDFNDNYKAFREALLKANGHG